MGLAHFSLDTVVVVRSLHKLYIALNQNPIAPLSTSNEHVVLWLTFKLSPHVAPLSVTIVVVFEHTVRIVVGVLDLHML